MASNCLIDQGAAKDCAVIPVSGVATFLEMYNLEDWQANVAAGNVTKDADGKITNILNAVGVQAFRFEVPDEAGIIPSTPIRAVDGGYDSFDHGIALSVIATTQVAKNNIGKMRFTSVVILILKLDGTGEIYGQEQGMKLVDTTYNPQDPGLGSVIPITLKVSDKVSGESHLPAQIEAASGTTKDLLESLETIGV